MKLAGIAFTERGARLLERLLSRFQEEGEETEGTVSPSCAEAAGGLSIRRETLKEWTKRQFQKADGLSLWERRELQSGPARPLSRIKRRIRL